MFHCYKLRCIVWNSQMLKDRDKGLDNKCFSIFRFATPAGYPVQNSRSREAINLTPSTPAPPTRPHRVRRRCPGTSSMPKVHLTFSAAQLSMRIRIPKRKSCTDSFAAGCAEDLRNKSVQRGRIRFCELVDI